MRILFKFLFPAFGTFMVLLLSYGNPLRSWTIIPLVLIAFYLSAAELKVQNHLILYRRFVSWKELPRDVADARWSLFPGLGYVKFKHFLFPWGKLYYVVERGEGRFSFGGRTALMEAALSSAPRENNKTPDSHVDDSGKQQRNHRVRLGWAVITIASAVVGAVLPLPWQHTLLHKPLGIIERLWLFSHEPAVLIVYFVVLAGVVIRNRLQGPASAALAFVAGSVLSYLAHIA